MRRLTFSLAATSLYWMISREYLPEEQERSRKHALTPSDAFSRRRIRRLRAGLIWSTYCGRGRQTSAESRCCTKKITGAD